MRLRHAIGLMSLAMMSLWALTDAAPSASPLILVQQSGNATPAQDDSPEARMSRRFPQKVRVGDLVGLPVISEDDVTLGHVRKVVRTREGKIRLIVAYSRWLGWFGRPVAVPIEVVASLGRQIASVDMPPQDYETAPTWTEGSEEPIPDDEIIRIAVTRR